MKKTIELLNAHDFDDNNDFEIDQVDDVFNSLLSTYENRYNNKVVAFMITGKFTSNYASIFSGVGGKIVYREEKNNVKNILDTLLGNYDDFKVYIKNNTLHIDGFNHDGVLSTVITLISQNKADKIHLSELLEAEGQLTKSIEHEVTGSDKETIGTKFTNKAVQRIA